MYTASPAYFPYFRFTFGLRYKYHELAQVFPDHIIVFFKSYFKVPDKQQILADSSLIFIILLFMLLSKSGYQTLISLEAKLFLNIG